MTTSLTESLTRSSSAPKFSSATATGIVTTRAAGLKSFSKPSRSQYSANLSNCFLWRSPISA